MAPKETVEELRKQRKEIEKNIAKIKQIIKDNESLRGASPASDRYLKTLEKNLRNERKKLKDITRGQVRTFNTPIQDVTVSSVEVKDPNEPDKGRELTLVDGKITQSDPTVTLKNGEVREGITRPSGFMFGMPSTRDAKDVGSYIIKDEQDYIQELYNKYSKDSAATIETKRRLIDAGLLDKNEPLDGNVSEAFRNAMVDAAEYVTKENYYKNQRKDKTSLLSPEAGLDLLIARGGKSSTKTFTNVTIPNRDEIEEYINDTYINTIGRKATKKEVDEFYRKVQKEAKAAPRRQTTDGLNDVIQEGFGDASIRQMATASAEARPEFLAYQLSNNFYNALYNATRIPSGFEDAPGSGS
jgi:hypothetical protein